MELSVCAQSYPVLYDPTHCSPPGSSVHGIPQARILEWVAIAFSRGSSQPRDPTCTSCISYIARQILLSLSHLGCPRGQWTWAKISLQAGTFHPRLQRPLLCFTTTRLQTTFQIKLKEHQGVLIPNKAQGTTGCSRLP